MRDLNCDRCKAIHECWEIDIRRRLEELRPQESERKPAVPSPVSATRIEAEPNRVDTLKSVAETVEDINYLSSTSDANWRDKPCKE